MYSAIKPNMNVRIPNIKRAIETMVPNPAKGTPINTQEIAKATSEIIETTDNTIPQSVINFNGIYE